MSCVAFILMTVFVGRSALLRDYRQGDKAALEEVYRFYVDDVFRLVRLGFILDRDTVAAVRGVADAEIQLELVQETFVRAFSPRARDGYDAGKPYGPYVLRIAKNLMIDRLRKRANDPIAGPLALSDAELDALPCCAPAATKGTGDGESGADARQVAATRALVASLSEPFKTFYELRYVEELSQERVAQKMGLGRRGVRTLERKLRKSLQNHLIQQGLWNR